MLAAMIQQRQKIVTVVFVMDPCEIVFETIACLILVYLWSIAAAVPRISIAWSRASDMVLQKAAGCPTQAVHELLPEQSIFVEISGY